MARGREATAETGAAAEEKTGAETPPPEAQARGTEPAPGGASSPMMDLEFVRGLIEAVDSSGIDSLELTRAGTRVKISKTPPAAGPAPTYFAAPPSMGMPAPQAGVPQAAAAASTPEPGSSSAPPSAPAAEATTEASGLVEIHSPMVGTFYRAPAPDAPPYVEVGARVTKGQTLCILEAMKLMNELESEVDGVMREVLVENAEPVEYGQVLFRIDPNG